LLWFFLVGILLAVPLALFHVYDPRDVVYVASPPEVVNKMLEMADIRPGDVVYDLGCGDGRILVAAAKRYSAKAFGFDIDPVRVRESIENAEKNRVQHLVTIREANIFELDLSGADVVMLYLSRKLNARLIPQLEKLKPGSRIVSHDYDMPGIRAQKMVTVQPESGRERDVYLWVTPLERDGN
jgi:SAM-dependent methyltransferase